MSTIAELLLRLEDDDRPGFLHEEGRWTFRQIVDEGRRRAALFRELQDPERPPHIGVLLDNAPDYLFWLVAAALSRSVIVGINSTYRGAQLAQLVDHSDCQVLVTSSTFADLLEGAPTSIPADRIIEIDDPAHRQALNQQRWLTNPGGHALPALAASTHAFVERQVVADADDAGQHAGPVADQGGALDRRAKFSVLDLVGLGAGEHELA